MGKETLIIFLGAWVAVQSFLGFPLLWDEVMLAVLGVAILALGISLHRDASARRAARMRHAESHTERAPLEESPVTAEAAEPVAGA